MREPCGHTTQSMIIKPRPGDSELKAEYIESTDAPRTAEKAVHMLGEG